MIRTRQETALNVGDVNWGLNNKFKFSRQESKVQSLRGLTACLDAGY